MQNLKVLRWLIVCDAAVAAAIAIGAILATAPATAQGASPTVTTIHSFADGTTSNDGAHPEASLIYDAKGNLYGTTYNGGAAGKGTIFEYNVTTYSETVLHSFGDGTVSGDGAYPVAALVAASDGNLYGTTTSGGTAGRGTLFAYNPGTGIVTIAHSFGNGSVADDGASPYAPVIQATDGNLYGTTEYGGVPQKDLPGYGTVFEFNMTSETLRIIHAFDDGTVADDGLEPVAGLVEATDGSLYGAAQYGGSAHDGALFAYSLKNGRTTLVHSFSDGTVPDDGARPAGALIQAADGNLYGTTASGGSVNFGTLFAYNLSGKTLKVLHSFGDGTVSGDGLSPDAAVVVASDADLYGTTSSAYLSYPGTIFKYDIVGKALTILHTFQIGGTVDDGSDPLAAMSQGADGDLYGTTRLGGSAGAGVLFSVAIGPGQALSAPTGLTAVLRGRYIRLTWTASDGATGYDVYMGRESGDEGTRPIAAVTGTSYTVTAIKPGETYYFEVAATNAAGQSAPSEEVSDRALLYFRPLTR